MGRLGIDDLEDLRGTALDGADQAELLAVQTECTFVFTGEDGWPSGVVMTYLVVDGVFWLTAVEGRVHVRGADRDPRVSVVVSAAGSGLPGRRMLSVRGRCTVHRDRQTLDRFLDRFCRRVQPADPGAMRALLDSPRRVVLEVRPTAVVVSHDQRKIPGNGRGVHAGDAPAATRPGAASTAP